MLEVSPHSDISLWEFSNYTEEQCLALEPREQVLCVVQQLNVTDPPSIYGFENFTSAWEPVACLLYNVTLQDRVDIQATFNYCRVPLRGADAFLFASIALIAATFLFGSLSTVWVLISGGLLAILNYYVNLLEIGNAIALWLAIRPADLFFYAFLPPLIVEQSIRIEFYMFRKVFVHSIMLAFVMVILTAIILTPIILFVLGFSSSWSWVHGALFAAIIAPTDALAVSAVLKAANGPALLTAIMEGESLLNDAAGITLFEVFYKILEESRYEYPPTWPTVWSVIPTIIVDIIKLSAIGLGIGLGFSIISGYILRWLRWRGAGAHIEATYVLAMAYLVYYVTNAPAGGSGVIAVVTFGLYGNATSLWGMLGTAAASGDFDAMWDLISFAANGIVFFWSGVASFNFFLRSLIQLPNQAMNYVAIPLIYIIMMLIRTFCITLFNPIFHLIGQGLNAAQILFVGWSGLRGAVSLIMVSAFGTGEQLVTSTYATVNSDISLWTSSFVVLTLIINGSSISALLRILRLNTVSKSAKRIRAKTKATVLSYLKDCISNLQDDDSDEFLHGADWEAVSQYVDLSSDLKDFGRLDEESHKDLNSKSIKDPKTSYSWGGVIAALATSFMMFLRSLPTKICSCIKLRKKTASDNSVSKDEKHPTSSEESFSDDRSNMADDDDYNECLFQREESADNQRTNILGTAASKGMKSDDLEAGPNTSDVPISETTAIESKQSQGLEFSALTQEKLSTLESELQQICLTGNTGRAMYMELRKAIEANRESLERKEASKSSEEIKNEDRFYCSLPTAMGQDLKLELDKELERKRTSQVELSDPSRESLSQKSTSSHPSVHLQIHALKNRMRDFSDSSAGRGRHEKSMTDKVSHEVPVSTAHTRHISFDDHASLSHVTVTGFQGRQLQKEISGRFGLAGPQMLQMDLMGKRNKDRPSGSSKDWSKEVDFRSGSFVGSGLSRDNAPMSSHLIRKSHIHRMKHAANHSYVPFSSIRERLESEARESSMDFGVVSSYPRQDEDISSYPLDDHVEELRPQGTELKEIEELNPKVLMEVRTRLIGGLKRHFRNRRMAGKISIEGCKILEFSCDEAVEKPFNKLNLWSTLLKTVKDNIYVKYLAYFSYSMIRFYRSRGSISRKILKYPFSLISKISRKLLGKTMLLACEVAVEYNLALSNSSNMKWLRLHGDLFWVLIDEVELEIEKSRDFIIDREIEAPDTFRAIQSYRAAISVLKHLQEFISSLLSAGIVNEHEREDLIRPIESKLRKLEIVGPVWRPPPGKQLLKSIRPFLQAPTGTFSWIWYSGLVLEYKPGQPIFRWKGDGSSSFNNGIFYVLNGVVKRVRERDGHPKEELFCGAGSSFGVHQALEMAPLSGSEDIIAIGNALGRGPTIFRLIPADIDRIKEKANSGDDGLRQILDGWTILSALYVVEDLEDSLTFEIESFMRLKCQQTLKGSYLKTRRSTGYQVMHSMASPFDENRPTDVDGQAESPSHVPLRKVTLDTIFSDNLVNPFERDGSIETDAKKFPAEYYPRPSDKSIQRKAKAVSAEFFARIHKTIHMSRVLRLTKGDLLEQESTLVLLLGEIEMSLQELAINNQENKSLMKAPAAMPWLVDSDYSPLSDVDKSVFACTGSSHATMWKVTSAEALIVVLPKNI